jgi:predicted nucleic acid-binding protein
MEIVTDTSVMIAVILNEPEKEAIVDATAGHDLVCPGSIRWEIVNAFSAMFRQKRISLRIARRALAIFDVIPIRYLEVDLAASLKLAHDHNIYAYDAYFLDCASRYGKPFLTLDKRLKACATDVGIDVVEVD